MQIAARLIKGQDATVVVQRSKTTARPHTQYGYPVHTNPALDKRRRKIIVRSLEAFGVADAQVRVMVAPALASGMKANEAEAAYQQGVTSGQGGGASGGFGGFFFGGGGGFF